MNKIAIFGDSFTELFEQHAVTLHSAIATKEQQREFSQSYQTKWPIWWKLLKGYDVVHSFGKGGTDIMWSYLQFLRHHKDYDTIIFVPSQYTRHTHIRHNIKEPHYNATWQKDNFMGTEGIANVTSLKLCKIFLDKHIKNSPNEIALHKLFETYIKYHTHVVTNFPDRDLLVWAHTIDNIKRIRPDVKMINAFSDHYYIQDKISMPESIKVPRVVSLHDICKIENEYINVTRDARIGHLTTETHIKLAELINNWLTNDETWFNFNINYFRKYLDTFTLDTKRYCYDKHTNLFEWARYNNIKVPE